MRNGLQIWRIAANILNKQLKTPGKGSSSLGLVCCANSTSPYKFNHVATHLKEPRNQKSHIQGRRPLKNRDLMGG
jgi:hypothetical protein